AILTLPYDINNAHQIVGQYVGANGVSHGFVDNGSYDTFQNDPNLNGRLFNSSIVTIDDPLAASSANVGTVARSINDLGQVVGSYDSGNQLNHSVHGFLFSDGVYTTIDVPDATMTVATGINNAGEIVGYYSPDAGQGGLGGTLYGFLYSNGNYVTFDSPWFRPEGISDAGQIVGSDIDHNKGFIGSLTPTATPLNDVLVASAQGGTLTGGVGN